MKKFFLLLMGIFPAGLYAQTPAPTIDLSYAAAKALPAVVSVQAFLSDSLLSIHPDLINKMGIKTPRSGSGILANAASGVLVSTDGYIMTNAHVVAGVDSITVVLPDRRAYHAALIGTDDLADLALLKIAANDLPFLELGDPGLVRIGDPVLAVGNPLELSSTVTAGILSARFRSLDSQPDASLVNSYLQSDAASNEGMSGSALVDRSGKLIGINAAIISPTGAFAGYAFAIPSGIVKKAWRDLVSYGKVRHAYLDIACSDMDAENARRLRTKNISGVLIDSTQRGGAAERAGLRRDDILLGIDKQRLYNSAQLRELLAQRAPGEQALVVIERDGGELQLAAVLSPGNAGQTEVRSHVQKAWPVILTVHKH
ncbi:S1C family serine protease [Mucilaginibacter sp. AW1-7]|uniref:S1C family serine protease n=1 Tax=Mucilaginibacter sp. AW1-7 TaxID=3349874 RepID=UPI003F739EC6